VLKPHERGAVRTAGQAAVLEALLLVFPGDVAPQADETLVQRHPGRYLLPQPDLLGGPVAVRDGNNIRTPERAGACARLSA
jgi:hypothetical protein